jgi:hypothetical protein
MLLSERIKRDGITITSEPLASAPETEIDPGPDTRWWNVTLTRGNHTFILPFGMGPLAGDEPDVTDVMSLLTMGVRSVENTRGYEDWCGDWGADPAEPGRAEMYSQWRHIGARLLAFLGTKLSAYLWDTQDDT